MLPLRLEIRNFLAYRSPDPVIFDGVHLACLTGANGAGKSSLLDAITWALWGKARARRDEDLVHLGQQDMSVQLDFEQEGSVYRIWRRRTRKSGGQGTLDLMVQRDGEWHTLSEPTMRATQEKINHLLRLDYDTFVHSAFLQQGKADAFTTKAPAQRKQLLSDILGLDRWAVYEDEVKEMIKGISAEITVIDALIDEIDRDLAREPELRRQLAEAEMAQREAQARLDEADARLREVEQAPNEYRAAQERKAALERAIKERERDLEAAEDEIGGHRRRIAEYNATISLREEIEQGYAALQSARELDHDLGDKLLQLQDVDAERNELQRQLDAARAELVRDASSYEATIKQLTHTLDGAKPEELSRVQAEILTLEDLEAQRDRFQDELNALEKERAELKGGNESLRREMNDIKARMDRLRSMTGATCPTCGQPLDEAHRAELLDEYQTQGTAKGDEFRANNQRLEAMGTDIDQRKARVSELNQELKRLGALKERAASLQANMDAANDATTRLEEVRAQLDAVREALDGETFGQELRQRLAQLDQQREALGYDTAQHTAAREQLRTYSEYENRHRALEMALNSLPDAEAALAGAVERRARLESALADERGQLELLIVDIGMLELKVKEYQQREQEVRMLRLAERDANDKLVIARQSLKSLDSQRELRERREAEREDKQAQKMLYEDLRLAFSKNGIPAMIIETAIPELETGANHLLARMTDGRMHLSMNTLREKVTGGTAETLEIQIADELGTRSYELYSGGEAFRIDFAIRVALSQLLARRAGAHLRTLFLDEGFGTQDQDGRTKLVEAITAVQNDFDLILVITHIEELRDQFPVHVIVDKADDGSRVRVM